MMKFWYCSVLFLLLGSLAEASLSAQQILTAIQVHLERHYSVEGEWQLDLIRGFEIPEGTDSVVIENLPSLPSSSMIVRIGLFDGGHELGTRNVAIRAKLWQNALIARTPLTRGHSVEPQDLEVQRIDMLKESGAVPMEAAQNGDYIFARSIPAGRVLHWRDLEQRPIVQRGEMVEVAAIDGGLSVVLKGMALEDGARGELIRIRNLQSHREIAALVVSEGRAEIRF